MTMMKMYYYNINQNNFIMIKYLIIYNITIISATKSLIQPRKKSEKNANYYAYDVLHLIIFTFGNLTPF